MAGKKKKKEGEAGERQQLRQSGESRLIGPRIAIDLSNNKDMQYIFESGLVSSWSLHSAMVMAVFQIDSAVTELARTSATEEPMARPAPHHERS